MPVRKPVWDHGDAHREEIKTTWLGHASVLIEMPHRSGVERGIRFLFDPVLGDYCAPVSHSKFKRITPPASRVEGLPDVDAVVISHNHYDHLDYKTIEALFKRSRIPHIFAPKGNDKVLQSFGIPSSHIHTLDWWDNRRVELQLPTAAGESKPLHVDITCTPAQHNSGRTPMDRMMGQPALWSGWALEEKAYFAGDTAYRTLWDGKEEAECPACPAFKEIGERFGGFDIALLPIGCYLPRRFMAPMHASPADSVNIFKDVRAKRAIAMHWGTFVLSDEPVLEPPELLKKEASAAGLADDAFTACELGETRFF
ncbi:beta-lactamase superfamily domain-containing protein [Schizophyllum fasciatum]